jgi:hypothetical protein
VKKKALNELWVISVVFLLHMVMKCRKFAFFSNEGEAAAPALTGSVRRDRFEQKV